MASSGTKVMTFPRTEAYSDQLAGGFWRMRSDRTFTDVSIHCNGTNFQCHRVIIAACSPVLEAMMLSGMAEVEKREIRLDSIPSVVLEHLLQYMYTGHADIPDELLLSTVKGCDYLNLTEFKKNCLSRSLTVLDTNNVISWFKVADDLCHDELKVRCSEILATSLVDVAKCIEFLELSLAEVSSYFTDAKKTDVDSDDLLDATIGWVDHKRNVRQDHLMNMVQTINLSRCSVECLEDQTQNHTALLDSQPGVCRVLMTGMTQAIKQKPIREKRSRPQGNKRVQERSRTTLAVLGGDNNGEANQVCWYRDPESQQLQELSTIPSKCSGWLSVCEVPGGFVVTGGRESVMCTMFLSSIKSWSKLKSLLAPRHQHASINVHRKILVLGGCVSGSVSASVHSLELNGSEWNEEADLPHPVAAPVVSRVDNCLFVMDTDTHELFQQDVGSKVWSRKAKRPGKRFRGARMTSARGQLLVAGGWDEKIFACYNPYTDTWTAGKPPVLQHHFGALLFCDEKLFLIGGQDEDRAEEYDFTTESWSVSAFKVPKKLWNLYAVALEM